jgi:hypothetical protein
MNNNLMRGCDANTTIEELKKQWLKGTERAKEQSDPIFRFSTEGDCANLPKTLGLEGGAHAACATPTLERLGGFLQAIHIRTSASHAIV